MYLWLCRAVTETDSSCHMSSISIMCIYYMQQTYGGLSWINKHTTVLLKDWFVTIEFDHIE